MSIVDEKLAKAFLEDPDNVDLSEAAEITDNAATALSKYQGDLCLNGLTELSDAAVKSLSKHQGHLNLSGLTQLSDVAAESLAKHASGTLYFEIKNYRRIASMVIEDGENRPLSSNEGGHWKDEADFIFEWNVSDWLELKDSALTGLSDAAVQALTETRVVTVHIACIENEKGQFTYINHKSNVDNVENQFLKLFARVAKPGLIEQPSDGEVDLKSDWGHHLSDGEFQEIIEAYPDFIHKYSNTQMIEKAIDCYNKHLSLGLDKLRRIDSVIIPLINRLANRQNKEHPERAKEKLAKIEEELNGINDSQKKVMEQVETIAKWSSGQFTERDRKALEDLGRKLDDSARVARELRERLSDG